VVAQCYVEGVSTRQVDDVAKAMGIEGISTSPGQPHLRTDEAVAPWRNRPLTPACTPSCGSTRSR
jgi:transposase-like protein